jgi:two-component system alkaline phosphatase synthesis response regulator PhoP
MPVGQILVVDDEQDLVWSLRHSLTNEGYEVFTAYSGEQALDIIGKHRPDIVILDVVMPGLSGWEVCRQLRQDPTLASVPVLFLTVRRDVPDRIKGLEEGADDYLVKPFDLGELKARVKALLRRAQSSPTRRPRSLVAGPLIIDLQFCELSLGERKFQLTPMEFKLLCYLVNHQGKVFSCWELLDKVWGYPRGTADPSLIRWHIKKLRDKIEPDPANPKYIRTVPHHGYTLDAF